MPAVSSRLAIHCGARGVRVDRRVTSRPANRSQPGLVDHRRPASAGGLGTRRRLGQRRDRVNGTPNACDSSRASPRTDIWYPRSGVISTSTTTSSSPTYGRASSPGVAPGRRVEHDDAGVVVADAELAGRADHAVRVVPVRLAGADVEPARQHAAGQDHRDQVADDEVGRAADDLLRLAGAVGPADVDRAEPDRLLEPGQLLDGRHPADHEGALHRGALVHNGLHLDAEVVQGGVEPVGGQVGRQRDELAQPGQGYPHVTAPPCRTRG